MVSIFATGQPVSQRCCSFEELAASCQGGLGTLERLLPLQKRGLARHANFFCAFREEIGRELGLSAQQVVRAVPQVVILEAVRARAPQSIGGPHRIGPALGS
jgi:hypothetical protein